MTEEKYPADCKLSITQIGLLTGQLLGKPAARASDKLSAIARFNKTLAGYFGERLGNEIFSQVVYAADMKIAIGALCIQIERKNAAERSGDFQPKNGATRMPSDKPEQDVPAETAPKTQRLGRASMNGKIIIDLEPGVVNPRRPNTHGSKSMQIIKDHPGLSISVFLEKGGRLQDLSWDIKKGNVRVE